MIEKINYRDIDLSFKKNPVSSDVAQLVNTEAVKRSIRNLLSYKRFEKPFHPEINAGIMDTFFDLTSPLTIDGLRDSIKEVIEKYEPRVLINSVVVVPNLDGNSIGVTLGFTVKNMPTPVNFSLNLVRSR